MHPCTVTVKLAADCELVQIYVWPAFHCGRYVHHSCQTYLGATDQKPTPIYVWPAFAERIMPTAKHSQMSQRFPELLLGTIIHYVQYSSKDPTKVSGELNTHRLALD